MIIYNEKKEFIGIEEKDLKTFGLIDLGELLHEVDDFADLFVKTPGHIHNFKHVHWIDFIASADSIDQNKVILRVKGKNYRANIALERFYLTTNPHKNGYALNLKNVRELTDEEVKQIQEDLEKMATTENKEPYVPPVMPEEDIFSPQPFHDTTEKPVTQTPLNDDISIQKPIIEEDKPLDLNLDDVLETPTNNLSEEKPSISDDKPLELLLDEEKETPQEETTIEIDEDDPFKDYYYDPKVASDELGLPTDLVEEFIQDFITQAKEFKDELYDAFENGKIDILRMQSHKLKGVAANLRIEDAYDALVTINTSDDMADVKHSLDKFYNIILKKLSGEPIVVTSPKKNAQVQEEIQNKPKDDELIELTLDEEPEKTHQTPLTDQKDENEDEDDEFILEIKEEPQEKLSLEETEETFLTLDDAPQIQEEKTSIQEPLDLKLDELKLEDDSLALSLEDSEEKVLQKPTALIIDKEKIAASMGIDTQTYSELLNDFKTDALNIVSAIQQALHEKQEEQLQKLVIRFKGMSQNMHLDELVDLCEEFLEKSEEKETILQTITQKINSINEME